MGSGVATIVIMVGLSMILVPSGCSSVGKFYSIFLAAMIVAGVCVLAYGFYLYIGEYLKGKQKTRQKRRRK